MGKRNLRRVARDIRLGYFRYSFPLCCVLQFTWDRFNGRKPGLMRGIVALNGYVPCNRCLKIIIWAGVNRW